MSTLTISFKDSFNNPSINQSQTAEIPMGSNAQWDRFMQLWDKAAVYIERSAIGGFALRQGISAGSALVSNNGITTHEITTHVVSGLKALSAITIPFLLKDLFKTATEFQESRSIKDKEGQIQACIKGNFLLSNITLALVTGGDVLSKYTQTTNPLKEATSYVVVTFLISASIQPLLSSIRTQQFHSKLASAAASPEDLKKLRDTYFVENEQERKIKIATLERETNSETRKLLENTYEIDGQRVQLIDKNLKTQRALNHCELVANAIGLIGMACFLGEVDLPAVGSILLGICGATIFGTSIYQSQMMESYSKSISMSSPV